MHVLGKSSPLPQYPLGLRKEEQRNSLSVSGGSVSESEETFSGM